MNKTVLVLIGLIYLTIETSFAQCDADHIVILNNFEFVPSELVIIPGESVAFINIEGIHNLNGIDNSINGDYFNNPVDYFLEDFTGTPEGVCMGIIQFDTPGIYNFDSSYGFDAEAGMNLTINSDAFVLEDLFAELSIVDSISIWQSQYAFQAYTPSYLNADAPYTIFVPNDDAVADILNVLSIGQFGIFDLPNFSEILEYHIAEGLHLEEDLYDGLMLTSAQGQELTITENESGFLVDNAQIVNSNYLAYNGVIHIIDQCLAPSSGPEASVMQIITDSPNHEIFEEAILAIGLDDELSSLVILDNDGSGIPDGPGPWTLFAPTDEAFELFVEEMGWTLYDLINSQFLSYIIKQHIVNGCVDDYNFPYEIDEYCYDGYSEPLLSSNLAFNIATNLDGESLQFIVNENSISMVGQQDTVEIIVTDLIAYNGVVHVIDAVITPKLEEIQAGSCDLWTLELTSSIEEGWSGDALGLVINNTLEETITVSEGSQEFIYQFGVDNNDIIDLIYFGNGGNSYSYKLTDGEGQVIVQWAQNSNNEPTGFSGIYACEPYDQDICEKITIELINEFGYGWPYSSLDVYRNEEFDQSVEMTIGYSQITQINSYENDSFDFIVNNQLMFPEDLGGYKIRSESGTTLVDEDNINEAPESSNNIIVCESEDNVNISEIKSQEPSLVKMVDILGREMTEHQEGMVLFYIYENGKVIKRMK
tara:strand:- start:168 stop:2285 length:2118 start_codon:yes stop_codon:yes gene_type:complete